MRHLVRVFALALVIFALSGTSIAQAANGTTVYHQVTEREEFFVPCVDPDETVLYNILITYNYVSGTATAHCR